MLAWSIGEILWDIFPDAERFGGAPLNICANLERLGHTTLLLSAVGKDARGERALRLMSDLAIPTDGVITVEGVATGTARVTFAADGEPGFTIPRPAAYDYLSSKGVPSHSGVPVDWLYFGTLCQTRPEVEGFTTRLATELAPARCFYDMNLRPGQWNLALVQRLSRMATILKLNEEEARTLFDLIREDEQPFSLSAFCERWSTTYEVQLLCVTLGSRGCLIYEQGTAHTVSGFTVEVVDTVGAGDAFAAAFLHGYSRKWPTEETARFANALGALVASRPGATPAWDLSELALMMETSRETPRPA